MKLPIVEVGRPRPYPPRVSAFTKRFWDSLADGRLTTTLCRECGKLTFPPKPFCPHCWSAEVIWAELVGRGRLYSQTVVHAAPGLFAAEAPYRLGIVDLEEGLRIAVRMIGGETPPNSTGRWNWWPCVTPTGRSMPRDRSAADAI